MMLNDGGGAMKKRLIVYGLLALFAICVFGYLHFRPGVTRANYFRVKAQMTRADINGLLGGPRDDVQWGDRLPNGGHCEWWSGPAGSIWLVYDERERIVWKEWKETNVTLFDLLLGQRIMDG
jgi:hypothetical protein